MQYADILVIGGGPAGLSTAGALKHVGRDTVILDKGHYIGSSWAKRYDRLHLHTERRFSGLAHYPIARQYGKYLAKDRFAEYLQSYAEHFQLSWRGNSEVYKVRVDGRAKGNRFIVETENESWTSSYVVVTTGQFGIPAMPEFEGAGTFKGTLLHSAQYKTGKVFKGQRVLVVGAGNSGAEIAVDLAEQGAAFVALAIRAMPTVVPRDFLGTSAQRFGILLSPLPPRLADRIGMKTARLALGDLSPYGLTKPDWEPFTAKRIPIIDVGLVKEVKRGRVVVRRYLARLAPNGAVFQDGRAEQFDSVIAATGFKSGLAELLDTPRVLDASANPVSHSGEPTAVPGLYFVGYVYSHRGHLYEANIASRRLAQRIDKAAGKGT